MFSKILANGRVSQRGSYSVILAIFESRISMTCMCVV